MSDIVDEGQRVAERIRQAEIARARRGIDGAGSKSCAVCGISISSARRRVLPSAWRCFKCQDTAERRNRGGGFGAGVADDE